MVIPIIQEKLSKKLTSKMHNGFITKITIPAKEIALNGSYSLFKMLARIITIDIMLALTTETENPQRYAYASKNIETIPSFHHFLI